MLQDRFHQIDAAIVRIMKVRRQGHTACPVGSMDALASSSPRPAAHATTPARTPCVLCAQMRKTLSHNLLLGELAAQLRFPVGQVRRAVRFAGPALGALPQLDLINSGYFVPTALHRPAAVGRQEAD